jgi:hypothetical protein
MALLDYVKELGLIDEILQQNKNKVKDLCKQECFSH